MYFEDRSISKHRSSNFRGFTVFYELSSFSLTDNRQTDGHTEYSEVHHLNVFVSCNINKGVIKNIYVVATPHIQYVIIFLH